MSGTNPFRYGLESSATEMPGYAPALPGLGGLPENNGAASTPYTSPVLGANGSLWYPGFGQFSTPNVVSATGGTGGTGATGGTGGTGGTGAPAPAPITYAQQLAISAVKSSLRQASIGSVRGEAIMKAVARLFTSSTGTVTQQQIIDAAKAAYGNANAVKLQAFNSALGSNLTAGSTGGTGATGGIGATGGTGSTGGLGGTGTTAAAPLTYPTAPALPAATADAAALPNAARTVKGTPPATTTAVDVPGSVGSPFQKFATDGLGAGDGGGAGDTSTSSYGGSFSGPAPGMMGLAGMMYDGQTPSVGYGLASLAGLATGPAGLGVSALGQGLSALGFSPSTDPHGTQTAANNLGMAADENAASVDQGPSAIGVNDPNQEVEQGQFSGVDDSSAGADAGAGYAGGSSPSAADYAGAGFGDPGAAEAAGEAAAASGAEQGGDTGGSDAGGADQGGADAGSDADGANGGAGSNSGSDSDGYARGGMVQNTQGWQHFASGGLVPTQSRMGPWFSDSYMTPNREPTPPFIGRPEDVPMHAPNGVLPGHYAEGGEAGASPGVIPGAYAHGGETNFQAGGDVTQSRLGPPNPPGPDTGTAFLQDGEYVVRAAMVPQYRDVLEKINNGTYPTHGYAEGGLVEGAPPMSGYEMDQGPLPGSQPPGMPMEAGYDDFGGGMGGAPEAGQDMGMSGMSGMSAQSPMMPPEGSLTPETLMGNVAMMGPGDRQTLQMAMADPNLEGALLSLLGAGFAPVLMSLSPQGSPGGMMPGGGAPMGGDPSMGGGLPSAAQGQPMGGYAGGGMVQPHRGASPPGVRPPGLPPTRQPMPFQARPAHGLSSMQPGTAFR